jgi:hypothetical protein
VESVLVIDGKHIDEDGRVASDPKSDDADDPAPKRVRDRINADLDDEWPEPPLNADGTIDDGPDPFAGERVQLQPLPIEDDPATTAAIDSAAMRMRRVDVLKVPGLRVQPMPVYVPSGTEPRFGYAYGVANGGLAGALRRTPVVVSVQESSIELEQPDGFAEQISDRSVQTLVGGVTTGFSGGVVSATNDDTLATGFGFHGLIRARVPFRSDTGGIVVPSRIVREAIDASGRLDEWFEHRPGGCPQWRR